MALNNKEIVEINEELNLLIEGIRPEKEIRAELDYIYELDEQNASVTIIEVHPSFMDSLKKTYMPVAKAKYNKSREIWTVYWQLSNGKWERYEAEPTVSNLKQFFRVIMTDKIGCFFG